MKIIRKRLDLTGMREFLGERERIFIWILQYAVISFVKYHSRVYFTYTSKYKYMIISTFFYTNSSIVYTSFCTSLFSLNKISWKYFDVSIERTSPFFLYSCIVLYLISMPYFFSG